MEKIKFRRLGTMLDCSRNAVMTVDSVKRWIDLTADMGYNTLMLYMEDTYEVDGNPYFGYRRGRYSRSELREMDAYAAKKGMELIPAIQTLAHLNQIFRWRPYADEANDCNDILLAGEEKTYELIDSMFSSLAESVRTRTVNIGMDEAHMVGRGKYLDKFGVRDRFDILTEHLCRVAEIAGKYGFECIMWGDMFFRLLGGSYDSNDGVVPEEVKNKIPENVNIIYWDYYSDDKERYVQRIKGHNAVKSGAWFAGGFWSWLGYAPHNAFSIKASTVAIKACLEQGVQDVFFTMWGDDGADCSKFSLIPSLYYAAQTACGITDREEIRKGFFEKFKIPFDSFMLLDLPDTANDTDLVGSGYGYVLNPDKYMLFDDCLAGIFDLTVRQGDAVAYGRCAEKLKEFEGHAEYGYLFTTMRSLCEVLEMKVELGVRIRQAYKNGDRETLSAISDEMSVLLEKTEAFYGALRCMWMRENKPFGFEVQDIRIGGLYFRIRHNAEKLRGFALGKIKIIEELEEETLDCFGGEPYSRGPVACNNWKATVTAGII